MAYPQQQQQPRQVSALSDVYTSLMAAKQGFDDYNSYLTGQLMLEAKARQKENEKNNQLFQNDNNNETPDDGIVKGYNPDDDQAVLKQIIDTTPDGDPNDIDDTAPTPFSPGNIEKESSIVDKAIIKASTYSPGVAEGGAFLFGKGVEFAKNVVPAIKAKSWSKLTTANPLVDKFGNRLLNVSSSGTVFTNPGTAFGAQMNSANKGMLLLGGAMTVYNAAQNYKDKGAGYAVSKGVADVAETVVGAINPYAGMAVGYGADWLENKLNSLDDNVVKSIGDVKKSQAVGFQNLVNSYGLNVSETQAKEIAGKLEAIATREQNIGGLGKFVNNLIDWGQSEEDKAALSVYGKDKAEQIVNIKKQLDKTAAYIPKLLAQGKVTAAFEQYMIAQDMQELYGTLGQDAAAFSKAAAIQTAEAAKQNLRKLLQETDMEESTLREVIKQKEKQIKAEEPVPVVTDLIEGGNEDEVIRDGFQGLMQGRESNDYNSVNIHGTKNTDAYSGSEYGPRGDKKVSDLTLDEIRLMQGTTYGTPGKKFAAAGRYQFINSTLFGNKSKGYTDGLLYQIAADKKNNVSYRELLNKKFTPEFQDFLLKKHLQYNAPAVHRYLFTPGYVSKGQEDQALNAAQYVFGKQWESFDAVKYPQRQELLRAQLRRMRSSLLNLKPKQA